MDYLFILYLMWDWLALLVDCIRVLYFWISCFLGIWFQSRRCIINDFFCVERLNVWLSLRYPCDPCINKFLYNINASRLVRSNGNSSFFFVKRAERVSFQNNSKTRQDFEVVWSQANLSTRVPKQRQKHDNYTSSNSQSPIIINLLSFVFPLHKSLCKTTT